MQLAAGQIENLSSLRSKQCLLLPFAIFTPVDTVQDMPGNTLILNPNNCPLTLVKHMWGSGVLYPALSFCHCPQWTVMLSWKCVWMFTCLCFTVRVCMRVLLRLNFAPALAQGNVLGIAPLCLALWPLGVSTFACQLPSHFNYQTSHRLLRAPEMLDLE